MQELENEKPARGEGGRSSSIRKKIYLAIGIVISILVIVAVVIISLHYTVWDRELKVAVAQVGEEQNSMVTWDVSKPVESIKISVVHDGRESFSVKLSDSNSLARGTYVVPTFYGKQKISVTAQWDCWSETVSKKVNVFASTYNIAPLTATMPVTIFSLQLDSITNNGAIPTFVWFKRSGAWDYSQMPQAVYTIPVASYVEIIGNKGQETIYSKTSEWIKELYQINPSSHFNLFYNDYYAYGWLQATIANDIPSENYNVTLISDGTASFEYFNKHFDNENASANYDKMKANYVKLKEQVATKHYYKQNTSKFVISGDECREYAYVMAREETNVQWWLTRVSGTLANNNVDMYNQVTQDVADGNIAVKDLNTLLKGLTPEKQQELKALYNFSDTMFEKAEQENKKVMIILGTWTSTETSTNFDEYVKAVKAYYGEEYVYYYKGHPKNPTNSENGKLEKLQALGLIDIDATIPAELLFFFNPESTAVGYSSTTFVSLSDEQSGGVWGFEKDNFAESYKDNLEVFFSVAKDSTKYASYAENDKSILLEFKDTTMAEFAIYNPTTNKLTKYKKVNESYEPIA